MTPDDAAVIRRIESKIDEPEELHHPRCVGVPCSCREEIEADAEGARDMRGDR